MIMKNIGTVKNDNMLYETKMKGIKKNAMKFEIMIVKTAAIAIFRCFRWLVKKPSFSA